MAGILERLMTETWPAKMAQSALHALMAPGNAYKSTPENPVTTGEMVAPAADLAGLIMGGSYAAPAVKGGAGMGIRAYHGSPHDFDRFDLSKIGTGEGAQAYGHGLYFAENPAVAADYKRKLALQPNSLTQEVEGLRIGGEPLKKRFDIDNMPEFAQLAADNNVAGMQQLVADRLGRWRDLAADQSYQFRDYARDKVGAYEGLDKALRSGEMITNPKPPKGRMYEVNINAKPEQFLDWDKPLAAQPEVFSSIQGLFPTLSPADIKRQKLAGRLYSSETSLPKDASPGSVAVERLNRLMGQENATGALREAGIPGIKYLDQGSRTAGEGSRNYVVFDDKLIDILKKYGLAGASPLAALMAGGGNEAQAAP